MSTKVNLSGPTLGANTYAGKFAGKYIAAALLSGDTLSKGLITIHENIAYKEVLRNWAESISIDAATCDFTDNSSVTLNEYVLTLTDKQVNLELCKNNLWNTWEAARSGITSWKKLPKDFNDFLIARVAAAVAEKIELGIWSSSLWYTGVSQNGMGGYLVDNGALNAAGGAYTTATTSSNILTRMQDMLDALPNALYGDPDVCMYVSPLWKRLYMQALSADGYKDMSYVGEKPMDFQGVRVEMVKGLTTVNASTADEVQAVLAHKGNLHFGTSLLAETNKVAVLDMEAVDLSNNVRVAMHFSGGILATNPTQCVVAEVDIP